MQHSIIWLPVTNVVLLVLSLRASACKNVFFEWMPLYALDLSFIAIKVLYLILQVPDVKQLYLLVSGSWQQVNTVYRIPPHLLYLRIVLLYLENRFTRIVPWILHQYLVIFAPSYDEWMKRMPVDAKHIRIMFLKDHFRLWGWKIKDDHFTVVGARREFDSAHGARNVTNTCIWMRRKSILRLNCVITVYDVAGLVTAD